MTEPQHHAFYQEGLTGFRALAAFWVMLFHLNAIVGPREIAVDVLGLHIELHPLMTVGWVGANLFFVLSGFLLATHLLDRLARPEAQRGGVHRRYFVARIRRVFPAYWAQLVILLTVAVATTQALPETPGELLLHAFMLHGFKEKTAFAINPVYWTLPIEFGFYLCLPFVAGLLARAERRGRGKWWTLFALYAVSVALVWVYRYAAFQSHATGPVNSIVWAMNQLPGTFDQFMAGVTAGTALRWWRIDRGAAAHAPRGLASTGLAAAGLAGVVGMMYFLDAIYEVYWAGHWAVYVWYSITALFGAVLLAGIALGGRFTRALFENRVAVFLGTVSYSIYLWHFPLAMWIAHAIDMQGMGIARFLAITVPVIVAASALSYYAVERPFLRKG